MCALFGKGGNLKRIYECMHCQKGFHLNCFALYHQRWALKKCPPSILTIIEAIEKPEKR